VHLLVGHIDVDTFDRHRQELSIIDFIGASLEERYQHLAKAGHCYHVASVDLAVCRCVQDLTVPTWKLYYHSLIPSQCFGLLWRLADYRSAFLDAEGAQIKLVPSRTGAAELLLAAVLLFVAFACCRQIDTQQRRSYQCQNDRGSDRSENVADCVGNR